MDLSRRCAPALLAVLLIAALAPSAAGPTPSAAAAGPERITAPNVTHRVVWDHDRRGTTGIHLRSARTDGTDVRRIYDRPKGFTVNLTLDGQGRRVAFATCCSDRLPQLVVVPVLGGKPIEPLARHPHLVAVGGIGWSPNGRRLAFEAISVRGDERVAGIWSIRPNGRGLKRVLALPAADVINDALGWTRDGILYSDGKNLRSARSGSSRLVMRNVLSIRISGDHHHIVVARRRDDRDSVWIARPDGDHARRLVVRGQPGITRVYDDVIPNYDGSALLAVRTRPGSGSAGPDVDVVTWRVGNHPRTGTALDVVHGNSTATWN